MFHINQNGLKKIKSHNYKKVLFLFTMIKRNIYIKKGKAKVRTQAYRQIGKYIIFFGDFFSASKWGGIMKMKRQISLK